MITVDLTLALHIINMIVLMFVLNAVLYKPVLGILEKRAERIDTLQGDDIQYELNAQSQQAALDQKMREASAKAKKALDEAKAQAQAKGAEQVASIRKAAEQRKKEELDSVRSQIETARKELQDNTLVFAQSMAEKILGRSLGA